MLYCTTLGGIVQVSTLRLLAETAAEHGNGTLHFTTDQSIPLPGGTDARRGRVQQLLPDETLLGARPARRLLSTAPFAGVGEGRAWLRPGVFSDILQSLADSPVADLFVGDPAQRHVPVPSARIRV